MAFCTWLTRQLRECGELSEAGEIRLPTEAEWEKAACGTDGRVYPWGNEEITPQYANYSETQLGTTSPVGCFPHDKGPYGCEDLAGNVVEWCSDWYGEDYYANSPKKDPHGPVSGSTRVLRGGAWRDRAVYCRSAFRLGGGPGLRDGDAGFRLVRTPA